MTRDHQDKTGRLVGEFPESHHAYLLLVSICNKVLAEHNTESASNRMAMDYNAKASVVEYKLFDIVGVSYKTGSMRHGKAPDCIPGLIILITDKQTGSGAAKATHHFYTILTEYGVLKERYQVGQLSPLTLNNYPALATMKAEQFTDAEQESSTHPHWTAVDITRFTPISSKDAHEQMLAGEKQATVDQSRKRRVPTRAAANAAETSIMASQASKRSAPSVADLSNQPAARPSRTEKNVIVEVICKHRGGYKVRYSRDNEEYWETASLIEKKYIHLLEEFKARQVAETIQIDTDIYRITGRHTGERAGV